MKKIFLLFLLFCFSLPVMADSFFSDNYFYYKIEKEVIFFKSDNSFLYNLKLIPKTKGFNNDIKYNLKVFHYLNNNFINIYSINAYNKNSELLFDNNDKKEVTKIINSSSEKLKEFITKNYTQCIKYNYDSLICSLKN